MPMHVVVEAWWVFCATLVFLMIFGFLLLESGWVERRHVPGIAIKNVCMLFASSLTFGLWGYGLLFGDSIGGFCGNPFAINDDYDVPAYRLYQTGFASVAATILSGAIAGRTTLFSNVLASALVAGFVFPIHAHWVWHPNGFLHDGNSKWISVHDFAGGSTVHFVGGLTALTVCWLAGPRTRRPLGLPETDSMGYLSAAGVLILMIGWMGFNGGSAVGVGESGIDGRSLFSDIANNVQFTVHAGGSGALAGFVLHALFVRMRQPSRYLFSSTSVLTGAMGGLVAITAGCDYTGPISSVLVGLAGGAAAVATALVVTFVLRLDDPVAAIAVHAGGGLAGMISVGLLRPHHLLGQVIDLLCAATFTVSVTGIVFLALHGLSRLVRKDLFVVDEREQEEGLSFSVEDDATARQTQIDYRQFNTAVFMLTIAIAAVVLIGALLAGEADTRERITAICSVVAIIPSVLLLWEFLPKLWLKLTRNHTNDSPSDNNISRESNERDDDVR